MTNKRAKIIPAIARIERPRRQTKQQRLLQHRQIDVWQTKSRGTDRFVCRQCDKKVSREAPHAHLGVRRPDGTGWDHTRCHPPDGIIHPSTSGPEIAEALRRRRVAAGLMP